MAEFPPTWAKDELAFPGLLAAGDKDAAGQKGVRRVQEWCTFHKCATGIDGEFGSATAQAVTAFQQVSNLPVTGAVDQTTWETLVAPMQRSLFPNPVTDGEDLYDVVVRTAKRHYAELPVEIGGDNRGPRVRLYMQGRDGSEWKWCAGFACFILLQAAAATGAACPIPYRLEVDEFVQDAKQANRFVRQAIPPSPSIRPGCLFVKRQTPQHWYHTGLVIAVNANAFQTIEGNTDTDGSPNGYEVFSKSRAYPGTDFILLR